MSFWGYGGVQVVSTFIDRVGPSFPDPGCHACHGADTKLVLDLDGGHVSMRGRNFASLIGLEFAPHRAFLSKTDLLAKLYPIDGFSNPDAKEPPRPDWDVGAPLAISNAVVYWDDKGGESFYCRVGTSIACRDDKDVLPAVVHAARQTIAAWKLTFLIPSDVNSRTQFATGTSGQDRAITARAELPNGAEVGRTILEIFQRYGGQFKPALGYPLKKVEATDANSAPIEKVLASVKADLPCGSKFFVAKTEEDNANDDNGFEDYKRPSAKIDPTLIRVIWSGEAGREKLKIIHSYYSYGASSRFFFHLIREGSNGTCSLVDFEHLLKNRLGKRDGEVAVYTDERAMDLGFGAWPW